MNHHLIPAAAALMLFAAPAMAQDAAAPAKADAATHPTTGSAAEAMQADLAGADGTPHGTVKAMPTPSGMLHLTVDLTDVPQGVYAAHLHETGLCEGPKFESAGGHLAKDGQEHGVLTEGGPHAGDLPNIHVPESGALTVEYFVPDLGADMISDSDGTAFMLHEGQDDLTSQLWGDAGGRMVCGVLAPAS